MEWKVWPLITTLNIVRNETPENIQNGLINHSMQANDGLLPAFSNQSLHLTLTVGQIWIFTLLHPRAQYDDEPSMFSISGSQMKGVVIRM